MRDRQRILWLTADKPDNISVGRQRIADQLTDRGYDVTVCGTTLHTVIRSLREGGVYDAVVGTTRAGAFAGLVLQMVHRLPLVVDHVDPVRQFQETHPGWLATLVTHMEKVAFARAEQVLYVYPEERERVSRYANSLAQTDLGLEFDQFASPDPEVVETARAALNQKSVRGNVAIYVGGLEPIYNIEPLLAAMPTLEEWSLVVVGDGDLRDEVVSAAAEQDNVYYFGTVPHQEVPGYLAVADVGISLVDDPHTLKVLEYGASGLPVVQAAGRAEDRFGDLVEYCEPKPERIADGIRRAGDEGADGALASYASEFDWAEIATDYERALDIVTAP